VSPASPHRFKPFLFVGTHTKTSQRPPTMRKRHFGVIRPLTDGKMSEPSRSPCHIGMSADDEERRRRGTRMSVDTTESPYLAVNVTAAAHIAPDSCCHLRGAEVVSNGALHSPDHINNNHSKQQVAISKRRRSAPVLPTTATGALAAQHNVADVADRKRLAACSRADSCSNSR
jgi:hypothetical protein